MDKLNRSRQKRAALPLPAQSANGNWLKIARRVPVCIHSIIRDNSGARGAAQPTA